jgi:prepilin-type N-terminal cleavage/methylation domain-containing protein
MKQIGQIAEKGFSLIEVLIALVILAIGILVIAQMQAAAINGLTFSRHMSIATQIAQQHLEYLRALPFDEMSASVCPTVDGVDQKDSGDNCVLYDDTDGDGSAGPTLYYTEPRDEQGEATTAAAPGMKFYLRWWVERGGTAGTPGAANGMGTPGPGQMVITVQVIWWEKQSPPASWWTASNAGIRTSKGNLVELRCLRQLDF